LILVIDNYDSFVHNLARCLRRLGQEALVVRNDAIDPAEVRRIRPDAIVLSPGPCTPRQAGSSLKIVGELQSELPILGVCLGHQVIAEAFGASVVRAPMPMHGQASSIKHNGARLFDGLPSPMTVGRYHSLIVDPMTLPATLRPTAWTDDGILMAFEHESLPIYGVQFHPESILTDQGYEILANFLRLAGIATDHDPSLLADGELIQPAAPRPLPTSPVTF
jgi:anthranilate synthase/aminodeoxychorismate synthase-like glutamine amidotransferase